MDNSPADNGEAQNPVEIGIGAEQNNSLDFRSKLESILFSEGQDAGNSMPAEQVEEDQTEDKVEDALVSLDGGLTDAETDPKAEDGSDVPSQEESEHTESEVKSDGFQKRIDRLTFLRKQAEEQVEKLTEEVNSYKSKVESLESHNSKPEPTQENPFADIEDASKIKEEYETARQLRFKCEENPEGFQIGEKYFDRDEVRVIRVNAMKAMEMHLPRQLEYVKHKAEFDKQAIQHYPWYAKTDSQEYKLAQEVMKNFKNFRNYPDYKLFVGDYVQGMLMRTASSLKKTSQQKAVPSMQVRPASSPTVSGKVDAAARNIEARYAKTQTRDDLKKAVSKFL